MATSAELKRQNPLFEPKFKQRSADTTNKLHIPLLAKKGNEYQFAFIGDSHLERMMTTGAGKAENEQEELVPVEGREDLWKAFQSAKTVNLGIGGDGIRNVLHRLYKLDLINYLPTKPNGILLCVGTNDIEYNDDEMVYDGIINLVTSIKDSYKRIKHDVDITVLSMLPKFARTENINTGDLNKSIIRLNYRLAHGADEHNYKFLDVFFQFYHEHKILTDYFQDRCHLNYEGYKILMQKLRKHFLGEPEPEETPQPKQHKQKYEGEQPKHYNKRSDHHDRDSRDSRDNGNSGNRTYRQHNKTYNQEQTSQRPRNENQHRQYDREPTRQYRTDQRPQSDNQQHRQYDKEPTRKYRTDQRPQTENNTKYTDKPNVALIKKNLVPLLNRFSST